MKSANFEFLRPHWEELASLGGFGESYAHGDPVAALVKLRTFGEQIAHIIHDKLRLPKPYKPNLNDLLESDAFQASVPRVVVSKLHALRIHGNHAAHGESVTAKTALWLVKEAYDLGRWLYLTHADGAIAACPNYVEPPPGGVEAVSRKELQREKKAVLERLAAQEAQMQKLLADLDEARTRAQAAELGVAELRATQEAALAAGRRFADVLCFNEQTTRQRLIDSMLADAGWNIGEGGISTEEVGQEVEVDHQPTDSGKGYADYILYDDQTGKALGLVEAKKTSVDAELGRTQAKCYADGLERQHAQRPVIFYTNGFDLWIWNDGQGEPPRKIYGFYSKDSLRYRHFQGREKESRSKVLPNTEIVDRMYQIESIKRVIEKFAEKKRKALVVQATGTGKTRVAVALSDALIRAKWAKRILFLCDRRELRKQAHNVFKAFLPGEPRTYVTASTSHDRDKRIYLATYPAMMKCFETFDVGFFDLIIADESHRSIYNRYRDLFHYFDALQVGLTATPVQYVARDTFGMFDCEAGDPTFNFDYGEAVQRGFLVPFEVETHTTPFLRQGIKYSQMSREQREKLEEEDPDPASVEHDREQVDKRIFNKDTNRLILKNLMERGIRDATGSRVGRTIIFARNHNHAVLLQNLFDEMYPQYGGNFCRVIDHYDPRAEELIDDFKGQGTNPDLTIAISVDMLDTGIDVPEVVNLVFAKPVYSYVKFWQMIGRGTRLCKNLFGPKDDKDRFMIFDHWGNFEWFDEYYKPAEPTVVKSLMQQVFESRVRLAEAALDSQNANAFDLAVGLLAKDIAALPDKSIAVRDRWKEVKTAGRDEVLKRFEAHTKAVLTHEIAPLMQWINIAGYEEAYKFDRLVCQMQIERLKGSNRFDDLKADLLDQVSQLRINLSQVAIKVPVIERVKSGEFWTNASVESLEEIRHELRGVMQYRDWSATSMFPPKVIDIREDESLIERKRHKVKLDGLELVAYRNRVLKVLGNLFESNETLQRIKAGEPVTEADLEALTSLVLTQEPDLDLHDLAEYYPETAGHLERAIRSIIGMDAEAVQARFTEFVRKHPHLASHQIKFLDMLQNHISKYGSIEIERLYEPPFTLLHSDGLDGVFDDDSLAQELLAVVGSFTPKSRQEGITP